MTICETGCRTMQSRVTLRALTLATLIWPMAPAWAENGIDLEALRDSYRSPAETVVVQGEGIAAPMPQTDIDSPAPTAPPGAGYRFPNTIDELIALAVQKLDGRPKRDVLSEACALVARFKGADNAWSRSCVGRARREEEGR